MASVVSVGGEKGTDDISIYRPDDGGLGPIDNVGVEFCLR